MAARKKDAASKAIATKQEQAADAGLSGNQAADKYVGQWNRLVSTTNWEKGRIICQWRDALMAVDAAITDYSDEAWAQLVGGVTSQHVGRLRRVHQRFGEVFDQYDGLYWSHFQAAIDWEDAEMWLEGAIHNGWSVSQMRGKRWETVGKPGEAPPADEDALAESQSDEDAPWTEENAEAARSVSTIASKPAEAKSVERSERHVEEDAHDVAESSSSRTSDRETSKAPTKSRKALGVQMDELPEDVADAFEQFKLAIIAQRRLGWSETTPEAVLECLDALRELALAPSDD